MASSTGLPQDGSRSYATQYLHMLQDQNRLPVIVSLQIPNSPGHYLSVTEIEANGRVNISNQWGKKSDKWVTAQSLYDQTMIGRDDNPMQL